ncbi:hypothetical protein BASA61_004317 [Batrachochytrium salamandrivorans]|nr:hypothetical protein BASA61_004317 [Batrachochytrium salamandrivorans]
MDQRQSHLQRLSQLPSSSATTSSIDRRISNALRKYIPLLAGILIPLATFLNMQSVSVPGWTCEALLARSTPTTDTHLGSLRKVAEPVCRRSMLILFLSFLSLGFGILATTCLFFRMLEKKIKWMTRLIILGGWGQGVTAVLTSIVFYLFSGKTISESYTAAVTYNAVSALVSLISATLFTYHHYTNQQQWYSYTLYELSLSQRQLTLLMITSLFYLTLSASIYSWIEDWIFDDALYWAIASFSTIGFGDFAPKTTTGRVLLPPVTVIGIGLIGSLIWSLRDVVLELLTLQLASQYSKWLAAAHSDDQYQLYAGSSASSGAFSLRSRTGRQAARHASLTDTMLSRVPTFPFSAPVLSARASSGELAPLLARHADSSQHVIRIGGNRKSEEILDTEIGAAGTYGHTDLHHSNASFCSSTHSDLQASASNSHKPHLESDYSHALDARNMETGTKFPDLVLPDAALYDSIIPAIPLVRANSDSAMDTHVNAAMYRSSPKSQQYMQNSYHAQEMPPFPGSHPRSRGPPRQQTMTISRSNYLPQVTIVASGVFARQKVEEATRQALQFQIMIGAILVSLNIILFGFAFAWIEHWQVWEGFYFAFCAITTIGYGDYTLHSNLGRSLFIWYIFIAIGSSTYFGSIIAELAMDQWTVTVDHIEKRVDRYERKAQLKKLYGGKAAENKRRRRSRDNGVVAAAQLDPTGAMGSSEKDRFDKADSHSAISYGDELIHMTVSPTICPADGSGLDTDGVGNSAKVEVSCSNDAMDANENHSLLSSKAMLSEGLNQNHPVATTSTNDIENYRHPRRADSAPHESSEYYTNLREGESSHHRDSHKHYSSSDGLSSSESNICNREDENHRLYIDQHGSYCNDGGGKYDGPSTSSMSFMRNNNATRGNRNSGSIRLAGSPVDGGGGGGSHSIGLGSAGVVQRSHHNTRISRTDVRENGNPHHPDEQVSGLPSRTGSGMDISTTATPQSSGQRGSWLRFERHENPSKKPSSPSNRTRLSFSSDNSIH